MRTRLRVLARARRGWDGLAVFRQLTSGDGDPHPGGANPVDVRTLAMFEAVGLQEADATPKSAPAVWDSLRATRWLQSP